MCSNHLEKPEGGLKTNSVVNLPSVKSKGKDPIWKTLLGVPWLVCGAMQIEE